MPRVSGQFDILGACTAVILSERYRDWDGASDMEAERVPKRYIGPGYRVVIFKGRSMVPATQRRISPRTTQKKATYHDRVQA